MNLNIEFIISETSGQAYHVSKYITIGPLNCKSYDKAVDSENKHWKR